MNGIIHIFFLLREEEREDFDTSTESKEIEQKEQDNTEFIVLQITI